MEQDIAIIGKKFQENAKDCGPQEFLASFSLLPE